MSMSRCSQCGESIDASLDRCPQCSSGGRSSSRPKAKRFQAGELIDGKYEVEAAIAAGGMGEVYKVRHIHLGENRVVKVLRSEHLADSTTRQRFLQEARIAASIKHPNVAILHDFSVLPDGSYYMVEEFVDGRTIAEHLRGGGRFDVRELVTVAEQVLRGLVEIHQRGIVHRDISPDNIMLTATATGSLTVKIIDLGIAKAIGTGPGLTSAGFFIGKPHYASPEQMRMMETTEEIDHRSDLYSLGIVLYEMVVGKVPFEAATPLAYLIKQLSEEIRTINRSEVQQRVPAELDEFIVRLLRPKRDERFVDANDALSRIDTIRRKVFGEVKPPIFVNGSTPRLAVKRGGTMEVSIEELVGLKPRKEKRPITEEIPIPKITEEEDLEGLHENTDSHFVAEEVTELQPVPATEVQALVEPPTVVAARPPEETPTSISELPTAVRPVPLAAAEVAPVPVAPTPHFPLPPTVENVTEAVPRLTRQAADSIVVKAGPAPALNEPTREVRRPEPLFRAWIIIVIGVSALALASYAAYLRMSRSAGKSNERAATQEAPSAPATGTPVAAIAPPLLTPTQTVAPQPAAVAPPATLMPTATSAPVVIPTQTTAPVRPVIEKKPRPRTEEPRAEPPKPDPEPAVVPPPAAVETVAESQPSQPAVKEGDVVAAGPGVVPPVVTKGVQPLYPPLILQVASDGTTLLNVLVGIDGRVERVNIIKSSGSKPLDAAAEDAARRTTFSGATKDGVRVRMWKTMRYQFRQAR